MGLGVGMGKQQFYRTLFNKKAQSLACKPSV
jgi:hypothetical protein